jgi:cell division protein FtsI/penicillin-binding protein 2
VMATVAASVQSGRTVVPYLLEDYRPEASPQEPLQPAEAETLAELMRGVVDEGSGAFLADLPGDVGAKTGTAEHGEPGPDGALPTHAWMVAFRGDLAVAVFVETGESGSQTAGPLLADFLTAAG